MHALAAQREGPLDERGNIVNRPSSASVASHHDAIDHRPIRRAAGIAAIRRSRDDVIRQSRSQSRDAAHIDLEGAT